VNDPTAVLVAISVALDAVLVALAWWHVLLSRRLPASKLLWMGIVLFLPLVGTLVYAGFGADRHGRRATAKELTNEALRERLDPAVGARLRLALSEDGRTEQPVLPLEARDFPERLDPLAMLLARLGRFRALSGNRLDVLTPDAFFDALIEEIDGARVAVLVEVYILDTDRLGRRLLSALERAAARGVRSLVLIDALGSIDAKRDVLDVSRARGVRIEQFDQRSFLRGRFQVNLRNHRKLAVVDGLSAYLGSANVSARHLAEASAEERSDDLCVRLAGPTVAQLTAVFAEDWYSTTGEALVDGALYPPPTERGRVVCRPLPSGPDGDHGVFHDVLAAAIHAAQRSVRIVTPYFVPSEVVACALGVAALRGLEVTVVVPERADARIVDWAARAHIEPLLQRGVRILRRPPPFLHGKLLLVDGRWALFGSSNVDPRSFFLNYELNLGITGAEGVGPLVAWEADVRAGATPVDPDAWATRGLLTRAWENLVALASPLL